MGQSRGRLITLKLDGPPGRLADILHRSVTVLVVDDDRLIRELIDEYLTSEGCRVVQARNAKDAVRALRQHRAELVLLDLHLPILASLKVIRYIRSSHPGTAVILMTGDQTIGGSERLEIETARCLAKPLDLDELGREICSALNAT